MLRSPNPVLWAILRPLLRLILRLKLHFQARRARLKGDSRTLRETLPELSTSRPEELAEVYEKARYGDAAPDSAVLESLRKDVRA